MGPDLAADYAERLKQALEARQNLQHLGQNPLLMSLMGWLHRLGEGGRLPEKRQKLYELCVDHLIEIRQMDKPVYDDFGELKGEQYDIQRELGISKEALRRALEELAYTAHHEQPVLVGTHDISIEALTSALLSATEAEGTAPDTTRIKHFITNRAGILIEADQERVFRFPHRTFQEYLAACYLTNDQFPYLLRERLREDDERWREALLLAVSYAEKGNNVWEIVEKFCLDKWPEQPEEADWSLSLRAAQAVIETGKQHEVDHF